LLFYKKEGIYKQMRIRDNLNILIKFVFLFITINILEISIFAKNTVFPEINKIHISRYHLAPRSSLINYNSDKFKFKAIYEDIMMYYAFLRGEIQASFSKKIKTLDKNPSWDTIEYLNNQYPNLTFKISNQWPSIEETYEKEKNQMASIRERSNSLEIINVNGFNLYYHPGFTPYKYFRFNINGKEVGLLAQYKADVTLDKLKDNISIAKKQEVISLLNEYNIDCSNMSSKQFGLINLNNKAIPVILDNRSIRSKPQIDKPVLMNDNKTTTDTSAEILDVSEIIGPFENLDIDDIKYFKKIRIIKSKNKKINIPPNVLDIITRSLNELHAQKVSINHNCHRISNQVGKYLTKIFEMTENEFNHLNVLYSANLSHKLNQINYPKHWKGVIPYGNHYITFMQIDNLFYAIDATAIEYIAQNEQKTSYHNLPAEERYGAEILCATSLSELQIMLSAHYGGDDWSMYYTNIDSTKSNQTVWEDYDDNKNKKLLDLINKMKKLNNQIIKKIMKYGEISSYALNTRIYTICLDDLFWDSGEAAVNMAEVSIQPDVNELNNLQTQIDEIVKIRNNSPEFLRQITQERESSKKNINLKDKQTVNIYINHQTAGGVLGKTLLLIDDLIGKNPNLSINIFMLDQIALKDNFFENISNNPKIKVIPIVVNPGENALEIRNAIIKEKINRGKNTVHITMHSTLTFLGKNDIVFEVKPSPKVQGRNPDVTPKGYKLKGHNDLTNPYGTVILNSNLRNKKDNLNQIEIEEARLSWLRKNLNNSQLKSLSQLSSAEKWNPSQSVWTSGYFQDKDNFLEEMKDLSSANLNNIFIENGKQLLMHLIPGNYQTPSSLTIKELTDLGFKVIDKDGHIWHPDKNIRPITIILYEKIEHNSYLSLLSKLSGSLLRKNGIWIDFPVFVTGTASFYEAVSAGRIFYHDNFDTNSNKKEDIIKSTLIRYLANKKQNEYLPWEAIKKQADILVKNLLMGKSSSLRDYSYISLLTDTEEARRYSDSMYQFNLTDDILIELSKIAKQKTKNKTNNLKSYLLSLANKLNINNSSENFSSNDLRFSETALINKDVVEEFLKIPISKDIVPKPFNKSS